MVKEKNKNNEIDKPVFKFIEDQVSFNKVVERLKQVDNKVIGLDSETFYNGADVKLSVLQLSGIINNRIEAYVIDCLLVNAVRIKEIFEDDQYLKIIHNAGYDITIVKKNLGIDIINTWCTQRAERKAVKKDESLKLEALVSRYLETRMSKELQSSRWDLRPLSKDQKIYAAKDAMVLLEIHRKQVEKRLDGSFRSKFLAGDSIFDISLEMEQEESIINLQNEDLQDDNNPVNINITTRSSHVGKAIINKSKDENLNFYDKNVFISNFDLYQWLDEFVTSGKSINYRPRDVVIDGIKRNVRNLSDTMLLSVQSYKAKVSKKLILIKNDYSRASYELDLCIRNPISITSSRTGLYHYEGCMPEYSGDYLLFLLYKIINKLDIARITCKICNCNLINFDSIENKCCFSCEKKYSEVI